MGNKLVVDLSLESLQQENIEGKYWNIERERWWDVALRRTGATEWMGTSDNEAVKVPTVILLSSKDENEIVVGHMLSSWVKE